MGGGFTYDSSPLRVPLYALRKYYISDHRCGCLRNLSGFLWLSREADLQIIADGRNYGLWAELLVYQLRGVTIEDAQAAISCMCIASMAYRGLIFRHTSQDHRSPSITCNDGL